MQGTATRWAPLLALLAMLLATGCSTEDGQGTQDTEMQRDAVDAAAEVAVACWIDADCSDGNPCTTDRCVAGGTCEHPISEGAECDDRDACTVDDRCDGDGVCQGTPFAGLVRDPCVVCTCNGPDGASCEARPVAALCDDADCCTTGDRCVACEPSDTLCNEFGVRCRGYGNACDDEESCTIDLCTCEDDEPVCDRDNQPDGTTCEADPNACTEVDTCQTGVCVMGAPLSLDDGNPCTRGRCEKGEVLQEKLSGSQCDDRNPCTEDDRCQAGVCVSGDTLECERPPCASSASCDPEEGCVTSWKPTGATCDDGDACTLGDRCDADHACVPTGTVDVDDGEPCTLDSCDPTTGEVHHAPRVGACDDGDPCTMDDACTIEGTCAGTPVSCADVTNPCVQRGCNPATGRCDLPLADGTPCSDDDPCNGEETCHSGRCETGEPVDCSGVTNPCLRPECNPRTGACNLPVPNGTPCDDDDLCDGRETCRDGLCLTGDPVDCTAVTDPCLQTVCNPATGACDLPRGDGTPCGDGDPCNGAETCASGVCVEGTPVSCEGLDDPCRLPTCNPATGACDLPAPDGTACDDGSPCTVVDACRSGHCLGSVSPCAGPCDTGVCRLVEGGFACEQLADGEPCDDGRALTIEDTCTGGECAGVCPDGGADRACDPQAAECEALCGDADPCNGELVCLNGRCRTAPGSVVVCPESEVACWTNVCDPEVGYCVPVMSDDGTACDDLDACTQGDTCAEGRCGGTPIACPDDGNVCTDDVCDASNGSCGVALPDGTPMADDDLCDGLETCQGGALEEGAPVMCGDDLNPCTADVCDPADGSCGVPLPEGTPCDDGSPYTFGDHCEGGRCVPVEVDGDRDGWPPSQDCDDEVPEINPGAEDVCNAVDDDCDGVTDGPFECIRGATGSAGCGLCGTAYRTCSDTCTWGAYGTCLGQGICLPGTPGSTSCGYCGTKTHYCLENCQWGDFGECLAQGVCEPSTTTQGGCDPCSFRICYSYCQWSACQLLPGAECEYQDGTNSRCCDWHMQQFCLPPDAPEGGCTWSPDCTWVDDACF